MNTGITKKTESQVLCEKNNEECPLYLKLFGTCEKKIYNITLPNNEECPTDEEMKNGFSAQARNCTVFIEPINSKKPTLLLKQILDNTNGK